MPALEIRDVDSVLCRLRGEAKCLRVDVEGVSGAGENYGSTFLRVRAHLKDDSKPEGQKDFSVPMVCKMLPPTAFLRELFKVDVTFKKEAQFYTEVVPAWEALQEELGIPTSKRINLFAKLYGVRGGSKEDAVDDESVIVLENLVESGGYKCGDRVEGLDLVHSKLAVRELAKFHALGIALKKKKPDMFWGPVQDAAVQVRSFTSEKDQEEHTQFVNGALKIIEDNVPALHYRLDLLRRSLHNPELAKDPVKREPLLTFLHCDFWVNNFMFAYDSDGKPNAFKMVDFQMTELGSPAADIVLFLYTSTNSDVFSSNFDDLLKEYHNTFCEYLELHGVACEELGWKAFMEEVNLQGPSEMFKCYFLLNIIRAVRKVELENIDDDSVFSDSLGVSPSAAKRLCEMTEDLISRGWLKE